MNTSGGAVACALCERRPGACHSYENAAPLLCERQTSCAAWQRSTKTRARTVPWLYHKHKDARERPQTRRRTELNEKCRRKNGAGTTFIQTIPLKGITTLLIV